MKLRSVWLAATLLSLSTVAMALDIGTAKSQGLVGEQPDGYLGVVQSSPEAVQLASQVNAKRKAAYEEIAKKNGATLEQVGAITGQKAIEKAAAGTYIKSGGSWVKK